MGIVTQLDGELLIGIQNSLNAEWLTPIMKGITMFGEGGVFWIAVCLLLLVFRRTRRIGIICTLSLAFTFICCNLVIKPLVDRTRPWVLFETVHAFLPPPGDASFPSGHSANAMGPAFAMFLASRPVIIRVEGADGMLRRERDYGAVSCLGWHGDGVSAESMHRWSVAAVILAVCIGLSRLYLGMHFPTDVLCGLLLGMLCAAIVNLAVGRYEDRRGAIGSADF